MPREPMRIQKCDFIKKTYKTFTKGKWEGALISENNILVFNYIDLNDQLSSVIICEFFEMKP